MSTNGVNGTSHVSAKPELQWKVGLINHNGKYITAESFGYKVNVSGTSLKKKQTFILEQDPQEEVVYIRSHTGCYMSADKYGNITCDVTERGPTEKFAVEYDKKGSGKWAFKNAEHGNYLGGDEENFKCFSKNIAEKELWVVQLSIHPQINMKNVNRKRYANLNDDELQASEVIPWGPEGLVILHFVDGKYALKTCDSRYLNRDGTLSNELTNDGSYILEMRSKPHPGLAFKDCTGTYLTAVGATATMKGRNKTVSKDELFVVEDPLPQVVMTYVCNKKKVSIRQGVDVTANQDEKDEDTDREIFQMELVSPATEETPAKWAFKTVDSSYWVQENLKRLQATGRDSSKSNAQFEVEWLGDGTIALKACNGEYVQGTQTGQLAGVSPSVTDKEKFILRLVNRPQLVLKNEHGFVGLKSAQKADVQSSRTNYELIFLEPTGEGQYFLKGVNGKYWSVGADGSILADGDQGLPFILEPRGACAVTIKAPNGKYIKGEHNGTFKAVGEELDASMLWDF